MALDPREIYYGIDGERHGPVTLEQLESLVAQGKVGPQDHLWDEDLGDWVPARRYPHLFGSAVPLAPPVDDDADFEGAGPDLRAVPEDHPAAYRHAPELPLAPPEQRLAAAVIDFVLLIGPQMMWLFIVVMFMGERLDPLLELGSNPDAEPNAVQTALYAEFLMYSSMGGFVIGLLYSALLESSPWQATVGKRLMGLIVTNEQGRRIGLGRAAVRYVGRIPARMIFYGGYLMILFTQKRQGLHDMLAQTLVLKR